MPCEKKCVMPLLQAAPHIELFLRNLKEATVSKAQVRLLFCNQIIRAKNTSSGSGEVCALHVGFYSLRYDFRVILFHLCTSDQTKNT